MYLSQKASRSNVTIEIWIRSRKHALRLNKDKRVELTSIETLMKKTPLNIHVFILTDGDWLNGTKYSTATML